MSASDRFARQVNVGPTDQLLARALTFGLWIGHAALTLSAMLALSSRRAPLVSPADCLTPTLPRHVNHTELLHQAQLIHLNPVFH